MTPEHDRVVKLASTIDDVRNASRDQFFHVLRGLERGASRETSSYEVEVHSRIVPRRPLTHDSIGRHLDHHHTEQRDNTLGSDPNSSSGVRQPPHDSPAFPRPGPGCVGSALNEAGSWTYVLRSGWPLVIRKPATKLRGSSPVT